MASAVTIPTQYRQSMLGKMDRALKNTSVVSAAMGLLLLVAVFLAPKLPEESASLEKMPERFARLILEEPKAPAPTPKAPEQVAQMEAPPEPAPADEPKPVAPKPKARTRRTSKPKPAPNKGTQGRQKANTEVAQNLKDVQGSLDAALGQLSTALPAAENGSSQKRSSKRRRRGIKAGKNSSQIASAGGVSTLDAVDLQGSSLSGTGISVAAITDIDLGDAAGGSASGGGSGGGGGGEYRSNSSLLSVVRRYAAGIQFCYDNQLKKSPSLRGKLVVSLTVLANGEVSEARVVEDSLGSSAVTECVVAQIRGWKFPGIEYGVTTFKTPFVFTPPE